jgi:hypothetical protein
MMVPVDRQQHAGKGALPPSTSPTRGTEQT